MHQAIGDNHGKHQANRVVALLRAVINRAIRDHELDIPNPANGITFNREEDRTRRLSVEELPAFFQAVQADVNTDIRDFVLLALFTGARRSNQLAMCWSNVSLERGVGVIPAASSKSSRQLNVILPQAAIRILRQRLVAKRGDDVLPGRSGRKKVHMVEIKSGWSRICKRAGLDNLHIHDLRRSLASFQIDTGSPLDVI